MWVKLSFALEHKWAACSEQFSNLSKFTQLESCLSLASSSGLFDSKDHILLVTLHWHSAQTLNEWHFIFILKLCCQIGIDKFKYIQYGEIGKKKVGCKGQTVKTQNGELLSSVLASLPHLFLPEIKSFFIFLGEAYKDWMKRTKSVKVPLVWRLCVYRKKYLTIKFSFSVETENCVFYSILEQE